MQPVIRTRRYVPFNIGNGIFIALWNAYANKLTRNPASISEAGLMLPRTDSSLDDCDQASSRSPTMTCSSSASLSPTLTAT
jgi:hypothetical protein